MDTPKVQILHNRNPDYECDVRIWFDGKLMTGLVMEDIDPGRGTDWETWLQRIAWAYEAAKDSPTDSYEAAVLGSLIEAADSQFITDGPDDDEERERQIERVCGGGETVEGVLS